MDGVATYAGLVYWDGYFYYFNSSMKAVRSRTYWPTVTNDLIPVAEYTFDENGRITNPPVVGIDAQGQLKNGIYADADGEIRYYVNGIATYAKLVYFNGHYYYIGSSLKAVRDTTHWVSATNGLMEAGSYTFDAQGRMIDPPEDALTEAISTFTLSGETMSKTYDYVYASGKLMRQVLTVTIGNSTTTYAMDFFYDASGYPFAVKYNGDLCYYITNLQGDVMSIVDAQGEVVAEYEYDPYGNIVSQSGPLADVNPLRYRGYVFDSETQFYYLQSRYYDPELGRFLNADAYVSTGQGILGNNMFAYCGNNPSNGLDPTGERADLWPLLFKDHDPGFIHRRVQEHIVVKELFTGEFVLPGTGRVDIYDPETGEIWEIKHGGSSQEMQIKRTAEAQNQIERYKKNKSNIPLQEGHAGAFTGGFYINCENKSYLVTYNTPEPGVILYYVEQVPNFEPEASYAYACKKRENIYLVGALIAPAFTGGGSSSWDAITYDAYSIS